MLKTYKTKHSITASDIRRIDDSRQIKDSNGKIVGRQFYVIRRSEKGIQYGSWHPFQEIKQNKKVLRSYYNKHPQLPLPNSLADHDDEDEEFNPSQNSKKNLSKGKISGGTQLSLSKPKGRPFKDNHKLNNQIQQRPKQSKHRSQQMQAFTQQNNWATKNSSEPQVKGLFADGSQIIYTVLQNGKYSYQNRKWVIQNCKLSLIDFYESCMVLKMK